MTTSSRPFGLGRESADGAFRRQASAFRGWVTSDGAGGHPAVAGRYELYVSWACPWAHRTAIVRRLEGLEDVVGMSVVDPLRDERGWAFTGGEYVDARNGFGFLAEAYAATDPGFEGRVSVPVLWDAEAGVIVSNESADILRMLDGPLGALTPGGPDLYPEGLRAEIDRVNERVYDAVNNGVYKVGFATDQDVHAAEVGRLFDSLDWLEARLATRRYLVGDLPTEADWRLFTTLVRFDAVYHGHFKCNVRRLVDYPSLWGYVRDLHAVPGVAETVRLEEIKAHYYRTHPMINPTGIVPVGPALDFTAPHDRARLTAPGG